MNISFDYDNTLSRKDVQDFVRFCKDRNLTIWVVTARVGELNDSHNKDLCKVVYNLGIDKKRVIFMNNQDKSNFFSNKQFILHLDDDYLEVELINERTNTLAVYRHLSVDWEQQCWEKINEATKW